MEKIMGTVKWFDDVRGYGFIVNELGEDVFVHHDSIEGNGDETLIEGQSVEYFQTRYEKGLQATEVAKVKCPDVPVGNVQS